MLGTKRNTITLWGLRGGSVTVLLAELLCGAHIWALLLFGGSYYCVGNKREYYYCVGNQEGHYYRFGHYGWGVCIGKARSLKRTLKIPGQMEKNIESY